MGEEQLDLIMLRLSLGPHECRNVLLGACEGNTAVPGPFIGCSDPNQTLDGNATSGFTCS
jgi:hypothetical protein